LLPDAGRHLLALEHLDLHRPGQEGGGGAPHDAADGHPRRPEGSLPARVVDDGLVDEPSQRPVIRARRRRPERRLGRWAAASAVGRSARRAVDQGFILAAESGARLAVNTVFCP
jgi:hypothetical protein